MESSTKQLEKIKLKEINPYLTCYLCKGYLIDATTISECLHSFCRSCIIKFLQDNSFCPVCEVIINKAKPNLKLDKTLQDIVYKLVPELFLKEMTRRRQFYRQYPQIAARVPPEERGEDTERTIFNPQDCISLSMEYVSDDSTPGAICLPGPKNGLDKNKNLTCDDNQALMKRYLQCPGMCRVEVLKKFVRNKYNVDTNRFYIDILYKKVPLPDHYTLIDIAYIYSWKRNEPMTFYFRITDINKVSERFDYFSGTPTPEFVIKTPTRTPRVNRDRPTSGRKREYANNRRNSKINKQPSQENLNKCDDTKSGVKVERSSDKCDEKSPVKSKCDSVEDNKIDDNKVSVKPLDAEKTIPKESGSAQTSERPVVTVKKRVSEEKRTLSATKINAKPTKQTTSTNMDATKPAANPKSKPVVNSNVLLKPEIPEQLKTKIQNDKSDTKKSVYTNITLNRTNNMEIITKIQKVSNKEGQPIGLNIIKQTVKNGTKVGTSPPHETLKQMLDSKIKSVKDGMLNKAGENQLPCASTNLEKEKLDFLKSFELRAKNSVQNISPKQIEPLPGCSGQKRKNCSPIKNDYSKKPKMEKKPTAKIIIQPKPPHQTKQVQPRNSGLQSFIDNCKINIPSSLSITLKDSTEGRPPPLAPPTKNYIEILKLNENDGSKTEVLSRRETEASSKLCDNDSEQKVDQDLSEIAKSLTEKIPMSTTVSQIVGPKSQFPIPMKNNTPVNFQVQPSPVPELPPKVLALSKDNKLSPRSPQTFQKIFEESIKKPEDGAKSPEKNSSQKAPSMTSEASASGAKRNILEIASQLSKKTKLELDKGSKNEDKNVPTPVAKVPIPRLPTQKRESKQRLIFPNQRMDVGNTMKYPQTLANLHSNALGLNYTISVGQNVAPKVNGVLSPVKKEAERPGKPLGPPPIPSTSPAIPKDLPSASPRPNIRRSPCLGYNSPRNSPRHSPKSSPMVKHMYAPMPNMMDQLRIQTMSQKIPSPKLNNQMMSPRISSPTAKLEPPSSKSATPPPKSLPSSSNSPLKVPQVGTSPKTTQASPSSSSSSKKLPASPGNHNSPLSPNQILEKYNIQNLAQLTASLNFNSANFGMNQNNQLAALQHAVLLKHFEMQNRQNWLNMNQGPLLQYEKYLQSLKNNQNQLLGNIKEN